MQLEEIKISITADTKDAINSLGKLASALKTINRIGGKSGILSGLETSLESFANTVSSISDECITKIERLARAFQRLDGVKINKSTVNAFKEMGSSANQAAQSVDGVASSLEGSFQTSGTEIDNTATALTNVATALQSISGSDIVPETAIQKFVYMGEVVNDVARKVKELTAAFPQIEMGNVVDAEGWHEVAGEIEDAAANCHEFVRQFYELGDSGANIKLIPDFGEETASGLEKAEEEIDEYTADLRRMWEVANKYSHISWEQWSAGYYGSAEEETTSKAQSLKDAAAYEREVLAQKAAEAERQALEGNTRELNENAEAETKDAEATEVNAKSKQKLAAATNKETDEAKKNTNAQQQSDKSARKHTGALGKLANTFKRILLYRAIRSMIQGVTKALGEGIKNLYDYSKALGSVDGIGFAQTMDAYASTVQKLKNSIATALAPVIQMVMPYLQKLAGYAIQAANALAHFFAVIGGQSEYYVAKDVAVSWGDDAASAIGGANDAAEELKRTLLGFDEINALDDPNKGGSGGGGGGGGSSVSASDMFEKRTTEPLTGIWAELAPLIQDIMGIAKQIGGLLKEIWESPLVQAIVKTVISTSLGVLKDSLNMVKDVLGVINSFLNGDLWGTLKNLGYFVIDFQTSVERAVQGIVKIVILGVTQAVKSIFGFFADILERFPLLEKVFGVTAENMQSIADGFGEGLMKKVDDWGKNLDKQNQMRKLAWAATCDAGADTAMAFYKVLETMEADSVEKMYQAYEDGKYKIEKEKIVFDCDGDGVFETIVDMNDYWLKTDKAIESNPAKIYADNSSALSTIMGTKDYDVWYKNWVENNPWQIYANAKSAYNTVDSFASYWKKINLQRELGVRVDVTTANGRIVSGGMIFETKAMGGIVDAGQIFIAREAGPEMVGTIGRQTAVANNDQIISGIAQGVASALVSQNSLLSQLNGTAREILAKSGTATVSTASIIEGLNRANRRAGTPIIAMG